MPDKETVSDDIQQLLKSVCDHFDSEDRAVRERQLREWRRLKLYWDGFQRVWYSEIAHDWRIYDDTQTDEDYQYDFYDKPVNVFRAYLESVIAALSVSVPGVKCFPDDADNPSDIDTAEAGDKIGELLYKHNDVILKWIHALYIYCTEGMIACYNYEKSDREFGEVVEKEYADQEVVFCPKCEVEVTDFVDNSPSPTQPGILCPECGEDIGIPKRVKIPVEINETRTPKSRQILEVYGGLYVKIPNYAREQAGCPYLRYSYETHYSEVLEEWPELPDIKEWKGGSEDGGIYDPYERWARLNPQYRSEYPINTVTVSKWWLRPSAFNVLNTEDADKLKKEYPEGVRVVYANEQFCEAYEECLDKHWTITHNPLSDYLHHDPLGLLLTSIQDITNELVTLTLQTIEHGIPQTFADPAVLNFNQYRETEVSPGTIFPARPNAGKSLSDAFYEIKTSTLSGEVMPFGQKVQEYGQLVSGALPSLFGGTMPGGSQTASEYSMSRSNALQRLQTPWKMLQIWWKKIFAKMIPAYIEAMIEDERFVKKDDKGNFINVFIRKADLVGKIGEIELEATEGLPMTWLQKKEVIMSLLELNNPILMQALMSPENLPFIADAIGLNDFEIPGEDDRQKQYEEINILVNSQPIPSEQLDPMTGQMMPIMTPSVPVDPEVDNHQIEFQICRTWAVSDAGRLAKQENPMGYQNVLLHMKEHLMILTQQMAPAMNGGPGGEKPQPVGQTTEEKPPIAGDSNGTNLPS